MSEDEIKEIGNFINRIEALHASLENNPLMSRPWRPEELMLEELFDDYLKQKKRITKAIDKIYCWGEVLDPEFQQEILEILEGDKKIEKLNIYEEKNEKSNWKWKCNGYNISAPQKIMADKINELTDEINSIKKK